MSRSGGSKLDLQLNLSSVRGNLRRRESPPGTSVSVSPPTSCLSSELNYEEGVTMRHSGSPEATSMVLVGCPRCLMYVMLSEEDPRCPKCKSTVLLDVGNKTPSTATAGKRKGKKN
ncbi:protein GL2-INTERACTING REPRESSOR 1-like [Impatiens glandulifera]|uniref:protein GL2-INTERACTING REPRESSOR 1-like n=1 Tax=Impatiens glandulifera TaxID=253017 RepID=UPI001FB09FA2|nr:protein GL2-INTERACTING REPRESSOR 1-like [Impatiens glandulifera]